MENENMSIDVDEFVDSGIEAAGDKLEKLDEEQGVRPAEDEETATTETTTETEPETKEEQAEKETETETPQETDSAIAKLIGVKTEEEQQRVPVEDHIKLRKRAQAAEARVKELEAQQTTHTEGEDSGDDFLSELEDGDLVRAEEVKKAIPKIVDSAVKKAVGQISESIEQERVVANAKIQAERAVQSEKDFAKTTADYDQVTKAAIKIRFLTADDKKKILESDNPAKTCYEISKKRLTDIQETLGITPKATSKDTTTEEETGEETEEEELSDDTILEELFDAE